MLLLAGCQHRDFVDTSLDWYHQHEGGIVAQQRPPAPGAFAPYPKVGLTPTTAPELPSPALRQMVTNNLAAQRNLTLRTQAQTGTLTPVIPPPPGQAKAAAPKPAQPAAQNGVQTAAAGTPQLPPGTMGAVLDAADSTPATPAQAGAAPASPVPQPQKSAEPAKKAAKTEEPEIAMPEFDASKHAASPAVPQTLPAIPSAPPPPPSLPGFRVPSDAMIPDKVHPDYDLSDQGGVIIHFLTGSDQLTPGQDNALQKLVSSRGNATLLLKCSGESVSMDASDQTQAVELGLLRARTLAAELARRGVPASAIHASSSAFGEGARILKNG